MKTIKLTFEGFWREVNKSGVPSKSGVYCVYSCVFNESESTVSIKKLIYIGESHDANARIANHDRLTDWKKHLKQGEVLCYSFAGIADPDRNRAEAALIYKHKPPTNTECINDFPYEDTEIKLDGKTNLLCTEFTVKKTS